MDVDLGDRSEPEARVTQRCGNCRIALRGESVRVGDSDYCCDGCADGGPCGC